MLNTIQRLFSMFIFILDPNPSLRTIFALLSLAVIIAKCYNLTPYYNYNALKIRVYFLGIQLSGAIVNLMMTFVGQESFHSTIYLMFFLSFLTCKMLKKILDDKIFGSPNGDYERKTNLTSRDEWFEKYIGLCHVLQGGVSFNLEEKSKSREEILYLGLMSSHAKNCGDRTCLCKFYSGSHGHKLTANSTDFSFFILEFNYKIRKDFFENLLKSKFQKNWFRILYAQLVLETRPNKYLAAFAILSQIRTFKITKIERYLVKRLNEKITNIMKSEMVEDKISMDNYIHYERNLAKMKNFLLESCKKSFNFWEKYSQPSPKITELLQISSEIESLSKKINTRWIKINKINSYYALDQTLTMAVYNTLIRNSPQKSEALMALRNKIAHKYYLEFEKHSKITTKTLLDPNNIFIRISMVKKSLGSIIFITDNVKNFYGWKSKDLLFRNVNIIIPKFLRTIHQKYLEEHLDEGNNQRLNRSLFLYGEDNEGYIVPQRLYLSASPDENYEFSYLGILRPHKDSSDKVVVLEDGKIGGVSKNLASRLGIDVKNLENTNIYRIIPAFHKFNEMIKLLSL